MAVETVSLVQAAAEAEQRIRDRAQLRERRATERAGVIAEIERAQAARTAALEDGGDVVSAGARVRELQAQLVDAEAAVKHVAALDAADREVMRQLQLQKAIDLRDAELSAARDGLKACADGFLAQQEKLIERALVLARDQIALVQGVDSRFRAVEAARQAYAAALSAAGLDPSNVAPVRDPRSDLVGALMQRGPAARRLWDAGQGVNPKASVALDALKTMLELRPPAPLR